MNDGTKGMVIQGTHASPPEKERKAVIRCKSSTLVASKTGPSPEPSIWIAGLRWRFELFVCHFGRTRCFGRGSDVMNWTAKGFFCLSELAFLYLFAFIRLLFLAFLK